MISFGPRWTGDRSRAYSSLLPVTPWPWKAAVHRLDGWKESRYSKVLISFSAAPLIFHEFCNSGHRKSEHPQIWWELRPFKFVELNLFPLPLPLLWCVDAYLWNGRGRRVPARLWMTDGEGGSDHPKGKYVLFFQCNCMVTRCSDKFILPPFYTWIWQGVGQKWGTVTWILFTIATIKRRLCLCVCVWAHCCWRKLWDFICHIYGFYTIFIK